MATPDNFIEFDGTANNGDAEYLHWCDTHTGYSLNVPGDMILQKETQIKSPGFHFRLHTSSCPARLKGMKEGKSLTGGKRIKVASENIDGIVEWLNKWEYHGIANDLGIIWQDCCEP